MLVMKKWIALTAIVAATSLQAQVRMPQPSTTQTIAQEFGLGKIELSYSRPNLKGRAAFGDNSLLAPLGQVWRTGANAATTITFTDEVVINQVT
ncbi:MAG TPA: hypothetical protein DIW54_04990, partial [Chitinophagaceae bacterium]|nr:hypothetical protein [Chitinophagaceae bacterium]